MPGPHSPSHDHDAGGPAGLLPAKADLRREIWARRRRRAARIRWDELTDEKICAIPLLAELRRR